MAKYANYRNFWIRLHYTFSYTWLLWGFSGVAICNWTFGTFWVSVKLVFWKSSLIVLYDRFQNPFEFQEILWLIKVLQVRVLQTFNWVLYRLHNIAAIGLVCNSEPESVYWDVNVNRINKLNFEQWLDWWSQSSGKFIIPESYISWIFNSVFEWSYS